MNLDDIELVAKKFFQMCREHPEICPHDYNEDEPVFSGYNSEGKWEVRYFCNLCETEIVETYG